MILFGILRVFWPYALAAMGGLASERSGVINLALEGFLLSGAFLCGAGTLLTGSPVLGLAIAIGGNILLAQIYLWLAERHRDQQVLLGIAFNLLVAGASRFLLKIIYGSASNSPPLAKVLPMGGIAAVALALSAFVLGKTVLGLRITAAGDGPAALKALSLSVQNPRRAALAITGALCALGGACLTFGQSQFTDGMSAGRGYIAVAAVVFAGWRVGPMLAACLLFASAETSQLWLQGRVPVPAQLLQALPYIFCLLALAARRHGAARTPASLSTHHEADDLR